MDVDGRQPVDHLSLSLVVVLSAYLMETKFFVGCVAAGLAVEVVEETGV